MSLRRLLVATRSVHKLGELRALLDLPGVELVTPDEVGIADEPVEDGDTFEANALIKARFYRERTGMPTIADDSGLEVDALGGGPGVRTRRYAGEDATDDDNNRKLLRELTGRAPDERTGRYRCVLAFLDGSVAERSVAEQSVGGESVAERSVAERSVAERSVVERSVSERSVVERSVSGEAEPVITTGTFEGRIALVPRGTGGFGYDPIFEPLSEPVGGRTVGQMSALEKNRVSHRAIAARAMGERLRDRED